MTAFGNAPRSPRAHAARSGGTPRAIERMNLRHIAARHPFDDAVQFDERNAEVVGQHASQRGLARAAQPDERYAPGTRRIGLVGAEQLGQRKTRALQRRSSRPRSSWRISTSSGDAMPSWPTNSAIEQLSACASCRSSSTDALPVPVSRLARWRSEIPASRASTLRVTPRRERISRTRSPKHGQERVPCGHCRTCRSWQLIWQFTACNLAWEHALKYQTRCNVKADGRCGRTIGCSSLGRAREDGSQMTHWTDIARRRRSGSILPGPPRAERRARR